MKGIDSKLEVGKFTSRDCPYSLSLLALCVLHVRSTAGSHCYDSSGFSFLFILHYSEKSVGRHNGYIMGGDIPG
jgi:hypothetical protein